VIGRTIIGYQKRWLKLCYLNKENVSNNTVHGPNMHLVWKVMPIIARKKEVRPE
jgi:hypothetical protein